VSPRCVTFDVGGTLVEPWPSVGAVYAAAAREAGLGDFDAATLQARFGNAWRERRDFDYSPAAWAGVVAATFRGLTPAADSEALFIRAYAAFAEPAAWRVFPDVLPTLAELRRQGVRLGVISNWDERLRPLFAALGLAEWFEFIVVSREVGFAKPDRAIFRHAEALAGWPAAALAHVGDSEREDVMGARAAGWAAFRIARGSAPAAREDLAALTELPARCLTGAASPAYAGT
jgi:putative hydrolase of the HAD superfamily